MAPACLSVLAVAATASPVFGIEPDTVIGPAAYVYAVHDSVQLHAHLFFPPHSDDTALRAAVVVFHGGGWVMGDASWSFPRARRFAERGAVGVAAEYRLSNQRNVTPLDAMRDASDLLVWLHEHADSFGIDPTRIAAFGWSAGAHLAASAAVFVDRVSGDVASIPDALILSSPALALTKDQWVSTLLRGSATVESISPAEHVLPGMPPTLILIGESDTVTPLHGAKLFHERMLAAGNRCEIKVYPGVGHLFTPSHLSDTGWPQPDSATVVLAAAHVDTFLTGLGYYK